ncbi:MAG: alpha/beta hydrolase [Rhodospirillales bacterium]
MTERSYEVLDRPEVQGVLFYPRRDVGLPRIAAGVHSVRIPVEGSLCVGGKIFAAAPGSPVVVYFHGNGEIASDYDTIAPFYTRLGLTLFVVDYRGYGSSDGRPSASALIGDAVTSFARVPEITASRQIEAGPLYVMGRSLGSAAALEIVDRAGDAVAGLIIESGFAHTLPLIERIGFLQLPDADEERDGFGNLDKISRATLPTLIIHGERDFIIPVGDGIALYEGSPAVDKRLVTVPGAGHNDLMMVGHKAYFDAIADFCGRTAGTG